MSRTNKLVASGIWTMLLAASVAACGDLEDPDYKGESLFHLAGTVVRDQAVTLERTPSLGLVWLAGPPSFSPDGLAEFVVTDSTVEGEFPAAFELDVYSTPPQGALFTAADLDDETLKAVWPPDLKIGNGAIIAWDDVDADNHYDTALERPDGERLLGGSPEFAVVYIEGTAPGDEFFNTVLLGQIRAGSQLMAGYNLLRKTGNPNCYQADGQQVCGTWDELSPVPMDTEVIMNISEEPSLTILH